MKKHDDSCRTSMELIWQNGERNPTSSGWLCRAEPVKASTNLLNSHLKPDFNRFPHHSPFCTILTIHKATFHWNHSARPFGLYQSQSPAQFPDSPASPENAVYSLDHCCGLQRVRVNPFLRSAGLGILLMLTHYVIFCQKKVGISKTPKISWLHNMTNWLTFQNTRRVLHTCHNRASETKCRDESSAIGCPSPHTKSLRHTI